MAVSYEQSTADRPPSWLRRGRWAKLWDDTMRFFADLTQEGARQAIKVRFPQYAPVDALAYIGRERMLERHPDASADSFRDRLDGAWTQWQKGGTRAGIRDELEAYLAPLGVTNVNVYSPNVDGWASDANTTNWSRFWVVIGQPNPWEELVAGPDCIAGPDTVCGTTMTADELRAVRRHVHRWRPGHVLAAELVVLHVTSTDTPGDISANPALRYNPPNATIPFGKFAGYPGMTTAGPSPGAGYYVYT